MNEQNNVLLLSSDPKRFSAATKYFSLGYSDYISARILIRNEQHLHGVLLAASAIEKYFKAVLAMYGLNTNGFLNKKMVRQIKNTTFEYSSLNDSFIHWLAEMYVMRLYDSLPKDFKAIISRNNTLSELDRTVNIIEGFVKFESENKEVKRSYQLDMDNKKRQLCTDNWIAQNICQKDYVEGLDVVTTSRRTSVGGIETVQAHCEHCYGIYEKNFFNIKAGFRAVIPGKTPEVQMEKDGVIAFTRR